MEDSFSNMSEYDEAYEFKEKESHEVSQYLDEEERRIQLKKIYKKIDKRILTILCGVYFIQFLDKSLLNYGAVMGITDDLKGNEFSNLATILYCAYICFEPINAYLFQKLSPARWFSVCVICWGIIVIFHVVSKTYASLMVVRALLGIFEAAAAPGCIIITGMWYNHSQQLRRMGIWSVQAGTSTIIGGLLSFAFQHVDSTKTNLASWQIFFLTMGLITFLYGVFILFTLPESPVKAKFLDKEEKELLLEEIRKNQTGTENKTFKIKQVKELLFYDKHTWPMFFLTIISMIPTGAIGTFSTTIISSFGFTSKQASLMQMPIGVSTIISILVGTYLCAYFDGKYRTLIFISMLIPAIIGYIVLLCHVSKVGNLLALYLINTGTCVITLIYAWNSKNTAGYTKRLARNGLTMIAFAVGALIGPQLFRAKDKPHYIPAKIALLVITVVCIPLVILVGYISKSENSKKEKNFEKMAAEWLDRVGENYEFKDLTDIENLNFRYSY